MALFGKPKYTIVRLKKKVMPDGLWTKCEECSETLYNKTIEENFKVCPKCGYHNSLDFEQRIALLIDDGTFKEFDAHLRTEDPLEFKGPKTYRQKLQADQEATGLFDAVITGAGSFDHQVDGGGRRRIGQPRPVRSIRP